MRLIIGFVLLALSWGCQQKPTVAVSEVANRDERTRVLVDTRDRLSYESFHIAGSVHLHWRDFLILKNVKTKEYILDPDIIERLARRGVSPERDVVLLSDKPDSVDNKKWNWLLLQLDVKNVVMMSLNSYREANPRRVPQAPPERAAVWSIERPQLLQQQAQSCFVNWSDEGCL